MSVIGVRTCFWTLSLKVNAATSLQASLSSRKVALNLSRLFVRSHFSAINPSQLTKSAMADPVPIRDPEIKYTQIFINNKFVNSLSGKTFVTVNPSTGEKIIDVQEGDVADAVAAIKAARAAFEINSTWRTMDASARGRLLHRFGDLMERDIAYLASLETLDNGKPFGDAVGDMLESINYLRYFGGWADKISGKTIPADGDYMVMTRVEPVGVCGLITPWNYPAMMFILKLAPALAAGCTVVMKPAEQTPLTALALAALSKEAGFPDGVINVVPGFGPTAGATLVESPLVDKISFTGSTEVGKIIQSAAGKTNIKRVTLELGGKSPMVVMNDANIEEAVQIASDAIVGANMGQCCCAGSRTFVQEGIYDEFVKRSRELAISRVVGDPFDPKVNHGPQIDEEQYNRILTLIQSGIKEGAKLETGGQPASAKGYFVQPTVFSNVTDDMTIAREEIFGPVQQIFKFSTLEEAIKRANDTSYGLAAGILTSNIDDAFTFAQQVQAGSVWVNCFMPPVGPGAPFGGFKMSGIGREYGEEGLRPFCEIKTISVKIPKKNS